jgi:hypothetical protein
MGEESKKHASSKMKQLSGEKYRGKAWNTDTGMNSETVEHTPTRLKYRKKRESR